MCVDNSCAAQFYAYSPNHTNHFYLYITKKQLMNKIITDKQTQVCIRLQFHEQ